MNSHQFIKFLFAGGIAAATNFGSRIVLSIWIPYIPAIISAYCIGMITAFALNRAFVFAQPTNRLHHQIGWFAIVNLAAVAQTIAISVALASYLLPALGLINHAETIAHGVGVIFPVITSYLGHKHLTFRAEIKQ